MPRSSFLALLICLVIAAIAPAAHADGQVQAGAAVLDGTYHVGNSAGQYASTRDGGYGDVDPHAETVKNMASYGIEARESVRALVVKGANGKYVAMVSDDHYIPQDALWRRTAQLLEAMSSTQLPCAIDEKNLTMTITHNHSSPSYSSFDWGVWSFQDVFDFRFFDYYAHQNAAAVQQACLHLHDVRVSAAVSHFDAFQKNPMGPTWSDDGSPGGFPRPWTDHDLSVVFFQNIDDPHKPKPLATLVNIGQHPEDLEGYDLISGEYPAEMERFVDRTVGGVTVMTQNATGTSEVEEDRWHPIHKRELFDHTQYGQMEWGARQLASAVIADVKSIIAQKPPQTSPADDAPDLYGGTSYASRFIPWMSHFPVAMDDRWFPGPVSHPYPGVSSCRTDAAFQGDPRLPVVGLPDCVDMPWGNSLQPVTTLGGMTPGISTDTFESLGIPIPENYSAPSQFGLEDTNGVHMQAFRLGDILFTVCSCEQWVEQSYNIKTRTDTVPGNEYLGYDATSPKADATEKCIQNADSTWKCTVGDYPVYPGSSTEHDNLPDALIQHMRAQVLNDATGWDDPTCQQLGCGVQAESEPTDPNKIFGNFTHDDTLVRDVHGGGSQTSAYASQYGYKMTVTIGMANDYNGYIASYREYMDRDHYRKALTGWGPHSSDYFATRLTEMGHALKGDPAAQKAIDGQTDASNPDPAWAASVEKEVADQAHEEAKVRAIGEASSLGVTAYALTLPNDGSGNPKTDTVEPKDIQRFDAATFTWVGGNNYTDNPYVTVERKDGSNWVPFADGSGEVPIIVHYPGGYAGFDQNAPGALVNGMVGYRAGGQVWKWTATFEAFVSRFPLVDPQGDDYTATPSGTYRFVVHGMWRQGNSDQPYGRVSEPFTVKPWSGITVDGAHLDSAGHVVFSAGPSHTLQEMTVRRTARPPLRMDRTVSPPKELPVTFTIGPVDFPDTASDQAATGARFLNATRGYSGVGTPDANGVCTATTCDVEHYCLDCSFRPWLDTTDNLVATVVIKRTDGSTTTEHLTPTASGSFTSAATLSTGDSATISIKDAWGDYSGSPAAVRG